MVTLVVLDLICDDDRVNVARRLIMYRGICRCLEFDLLFD